MATDQYHEPPQELSPQQRTMARVITSMIEEAEAIGWYGQRVALESDHTARAVMSNARKEEMKHFAMDLEFLFRQDDRFRQMARGILFRDGDIVQNAEEAEKQVPD